MGSVVIIDDLLPDVNGRAIGSAFETVWVLNFNYDSERVNAWTKKVQEKQGFHVQVIQAGQRFHQVALRVKDEFSELIAKVPIQYRRSGKNVKEALIIEGKLSLWWLCEISMKNSEAKQTFSRLCQLSVILELIEGKNLRRNRAFYN